MKKPGTSENWGGKREGAGTKQQKVSEEEKQGLLDSLKRKAKETGKTWQDILVTEAYQAKDKAGRRAALKLIADITTIKESHSVSEKHNYEHGIVELPPLKEKDKEVATA